MLNYSTQHDKVYVGLRDTQGRINKRKGMMNMERINAERTLETPLLGVDIWGQYVKVIGTRIVEIDDNVIEQYVYHKLQIVNGFFEEDRHPNGQPFVALDANIAIEGEMLL